MKLISWGPSKNCAPSLIQNLAVLAFEAVNPKRHSEKPHMVRDMIVDSSGDLPRIELFARERAEGWDSWGNEI